MPAPAGSNFIIIPTFLIVLVFFALRIFEIISMISAPLYSIMVVTLCIALASLVFFPPVFMGALVKRVGFILLVSYFICLFVYFVFLFVVDLFDCFLD